MLSNNSLITHHIFRFWFFPISCYNSTSHFLGTKHTIILNEISNYYFVWKCTHLAAILSTWMGQNQAHFTATTHNAYLRNKSLRICSSVSVKAGWARRQIRFVCCCTALKRHERHLSSPAPHRWQAQYRPFNGFLTRTSPFERHKDNAFLTNVSADSYDLTLSETLKQ